MGTNGAAAPKPDSHDSDVEHVLTEEDLLEVEEDKLFDEDDIKTLLNDLDMPGRVAPLLATDELLPEAEIIEDLPAASPSPIPTDKKVSTEVQDSIAEVLEIHKNNGAQDERLKKRLITGSDKLPNGTYCVSGNAEGSAEGIIGNDQFAAITVNGNEKAQNDDGFYVDPENGLICVADGLGGYDKGYVATNILFNYMAKNKDALKGKSLSEILKAAHSEILAYQRRNSDLSSTATVATLSRTLDNGDVRICSCGDTALKVFDGERISQSTQDHNMLNTIIKTQGLETDEDVNDFFMALVRNEAKKVLSKSDKHTAEALEESQSILDSGEIAQKFAADKKKEFRLQLTQALGGKKNLDLTSLTATSEIFPDTITIKKQQGKTVLCHFCDGVTDNMTDDEIGIFLNDHLGQGKSLAETAAALKDHVISLMKGEDGKNDNITIILRSM